MTGWLQGIARENQEAVNGLGEKQALLRGTTEDPGVNYLAFFHSTGRDSPGSGQYV